MEYSSRNTLYFVMELCEGLPLPAFLSGQPGGVLNEDHFKSVMDQLTSAVEYLHNNKICHRDINPNNIMISLSEEGALKIKLIDFNVSKKFEGESHMSTQTG